MNNCIMVLFGATGDLAAKKLFPAAYNLMLSGDLPQRFHIASLGRREYDTAQFQQMVREKLQAALGPKPLKEAERFLELVSYHKVDFHADADYVRLKNELDEISLMKKIGGSRLFFLAVMPPLFEVISRQLSTNGLKPGQDEGWSRLVVEKPFGTDLKSAGQYNRALRRYFDEDEILRTDHYLGKEMIRNITSIRFSNPLMMSVWNRNFIDHIQIEVNEEVGIDNRAGYFDRSGMLRDMLQSHILQVLALTLMEPPASLQPDQIIRRKIDLLKRLKRPRRKDIVIGQYTASEKGDMKGYREENGVNPDSNTETFAALRTEVRGKRFRGVPVYIRTAKRMPTKSAQIIVVFKDHPQSRKLFPDFSKRLNKLVILVQPREGAAFCFNSKDLDKDDIVQVVMDYCHNCRVDVRSREAYETIINEAIAGNLDIFTGWNEIDRQWRYTDRIRRLVKNRKSSLKNYAAGSWGPESARELIERDGRKWIQLDL